MTLFDNVLLHFIFVFSPIFTWIVYQIYRKNMELEKNSLMLDMSLISMTYLLMKLTKGDSRFLLYFTLTIPVILAYVKKRTYTFLILESICLFYLKIYLHQNIVLLLLEWILSCICYYIKSPKKNNFKGEVFIVLQLLFAGVYCIQEGNLYKAYLPLLFIAFYSVIMLLLCLLKKSENMILYTNAVSLLEDEKLLHEELFKITHEIKNPIAVCKGYLDMFDTSNSEHARKYIPIMREEIEKVLTLLQDFLSIRKIKIEKEHIDIYYLLENAIASISPLLKEKNIQLVSQIPEEELYLEADYNRLNQVIINLFKNSVEAMQKTKKKELRLSTTKKKGYLYIEIKDSGVGMQQEEINQLQKPFFTTKPSGNGIGVYLSKEILKSHNGRLEFISKPKKGTTAIVMLPLLKEKNLAN